MIDSIFQIYVKKLVRDLKLNKNLKKKNATRSLGAQHRNRSTPS